MQVKTQAKKINRKAVVSSLSEHPNLIKKDILKTLIKFEDNEYAKVFDREYFYFNKQAIILTNIDSEGRSFEKYLNGKKSLKLDVDKVIQKYPYTPTEKPIPVIIKPAVIPDWVKNNAKWWSEGKISEKEYLDAIKFLIDSQIIKVKTVPPILPESENGFVSTNENFLEAIQVQFSSGDLTDTITMDTFSKFNSGTDVTLINKLRELGYQSYFLLESLPSKDKVDYYNIVSQYINPVAKPQPFDVKITGIMSNASKLKKATQSRREIK